VGYNSVLTVWDYLHSFSRCCLLPLKSGKSCKIPRKLQLIAVLGHQRLVGSIRKHNFLLVINSNRGNPSAFLNEKVLSYRLPIGQEALNRLVPGIFSIKVDDRQTHIHTDMSTDNKGHLKLAAVQAKNKTDKQTKTEADRQRDRQRERQTRWFVVAVLRLFQFSVQVLISRLAGAVLRHCRLTTRSFLWRFASLSVRHILRVSVGAVACCRLHQTRPQCSTTAIQVHRRTTFHLRWRRLGINGTYSAVDTATFKSTQLPCHKLMLAQCGKSVIF